MIKLKSVIIRGKGIQYLNSEGRLHISILFFFIIPRWYPGQPVGGAADPDPCHFILRIRIPIKLRARIQFHVRLFLDPTPYHASGLDPGQWHLVLRVRIHMPRHLDSEQQFHHLFVKFQKFSKYRYLVLFYFLYGSSEPYLNPNP